jgi:TonB-linked SusC/RagA family outer membrane protein
MRAGVFQHSCHCTPISTLALAGVNAGAFLPFTKNKTIQVMKRTSTRKYWNLLMKITAFSGLITMMSIGIAVADDTYAQVLETPISSFELKDASFQQAIKLLEQQSQVKFVYSLNNLKVRSSISFSASNTTLGNLLENILTPLGISFKVYENERMITLQKNPSSDKSNEGQHGLTQPLRSTNRHLELLIGGTVKDAKTGSGIAGANIIIAGTTNGTTTNSEGKFALEANAGDRMVISFIGYKSQEILVDNQTNFEILLEEDVSSLEEVVVKAGYWEVAKKDQTGNIARVDTKDIANTPASNVVQALQGRMAGVYVQQTTGAAGGGFNIQIRGQNSLRNFSNDSGNVPLYIVNGIPFTPTQVGSTSLGNSIIPQANPLSTINPNDIESIEILKDADATAIYGSRGANGVVLITTKKASGTGTKFNLNVSRGVSQVGHRMKLLNSEQYNTMRLEAFRNDNASQYLTPENAIYFPDIMRWDTTRYTDWQKELLGGTAATINAQGSVSGGTERTHFLAGGAIYRETSVFPGDFVYQRASGLISLDHISADKRFEINVSSNFSFSNNKLPSLDLTDAAMILPPVAPALFDDNGNLNWENGTWDNPLGALMRLYKVNTKLLLANTSVSYLLLPGLKVKTRAGFTTMQSEQINTYPIASNNPNYFVTTGSSLFGSGSVDTWIVEPQIDYQKKFTNASLNMLAGATIQQNIQQNQTISASGFTSDALIENIQAAPGIQAISTSYAQYRYAAVFGRIFYSWKDKYLVNLTGRRDGSSRFGRGNQFANFGAVGAAWIFSSEDFVKRGLPFLTVGKLRTSYGHTGSDQIGDYQFLNTFSATQYPYNNVTGLVPNRLVNPNFAWETNKKFEAGFETGFLNDRLHTSISWFRNISSNQLVGYPLPRVTGQSSVQYNLNATVENKGWEFEITSNNFQSESFKWQTSINLTIPSNKLIKYPNIEASSYANSLEVGKPLYLKRLVHGTGVDPQTGLYTFEDVNNNGQTIFDTPGDLRGLKSVYQQQFGGVQNTVQFKQLSLGFLFQYVKQTGRNYLTSFTDSPGSPTNQPVQVMGRWQHAGDQTTIQRFSQSYISGGAEYSNASMADNGIGDASFVRLKNISLSWSIPSTLASKMKMSNARIYALGQNIVTFTKYIGLDPETQSSRVLPPLRTITLGIEVSF